jgi:hypothetical protein
LPLTANLVIVIVTVTVTVTVNETQSVMLFPNPAAKFPQKYHRVRMIAISQFAVHAEPVEQSQSQSQSFVLLKNAQSVKEIGAKLSRTAVP